jgi:hypothetical protein
MQVLLEVEYSEERKCRTFTFRDIGETSIKYTVTFSNFQESRMVNTLHDVDNEKLQSLITTDGCIKKDEKLEKMGDKGTIAANKTQSGSTHKNRLEVNTNTEWKPTIYERKNPTIVSSSGGVAQGMIAPCSCEPHIWRTLACGDES